MMKLIFAQGNADPRYDHTRHNVGFSIIDAIAAQHRAQWQDKPKFRAHIAEATVGEEKVLFVKPTTFYNETGISARALVDFYKLQPATDVLVIHDDLALPFGTLRVRSQGSDAGNNGIKSLNAHLGHEYRRLRVGIWSERRNLVGDVDFVLGTFSSEEREHLPLIIHESSLFVERFIANTLVDHSTSLDFS